jgi:putative hydrolase of the HAD superfamily
MPKKNHTMFLLFYFYILPVLNIGGHGVHIPFHTTWAHERIDHTIEHENFHAFEKITDVLRLV